MKRNSSGSREFASVQILLLLRTMSDAVKEQGYQRKAAGSLSRAANSFGILCLNHALGAFASLRVSGPVPSPPSRGEGVRVADKEVTWLILPVVICLSQRLSHACLSINNFIL